MDVVIRHRRIVKHRQMPADDHEIENHVARYRARDEFRDGTHCSRLDQRTKHPSGRSGDQQRRKQQCEQQVLHHVGAEQVVVAQIVQRTVQRGEHHEQAGEERELLSARRCARLGGARCAPEIQCGESRDADYRAPVNRPARPPDLRDRVEGQQQQQVIHRVLDAGVQRETEVP